MADTDRFDYYARLSAKEKLTYRKSDDVRGVTVPAPDALKPRVEALEAALASGKRAATAKAANALVGDLLAQLQVQNVDIHVRLVRPQLTGAELHGLYTFETDEKAPRIEVWMKTGVNERTVKFRTFMRTLLHEVCHHLDVTLLDLDDSFHTQGFFRRESSLMRQLVPKTATAALSRSGLRPDTPDLAPSASLRDARTATVTKRPREKQLRLFED